MSESHLDTDALTAFAQGRLEGSQHEAAEQHVLECDRCCDRLRSIDVSVVLADACPVATQAADRTNPSSQQNGSRTSSLHGRFLPGVVVNDRYRIVSLLGVGGMGEVYRADDLMLGEAVALKFIGNKLSQDPAAIERLRAEVRFTRSISHPNVCRIYDIGETNGQLFISMEFIDGEDLRSLLQRIGRLPPDKGGELARQLCAGLCAAHEQGILHRDLKPANIMIDGRGQVRIADFGLAVFTDHAQSDIAGTPAYMAPEQLAGGEHSVRSDIFALGLVLSEIFTGERLIQGSTIQEVQSQYELNPSPAFSHDMDPEIEKVILRCLEKRATDRPESITSILPMLPGMDGLEAVLAAGETPSPELLAANRRFDQPMPMPVALTCFGLLLGGIATLLLLPFGNLGGLIHSVDFPLEPAILHHKARETVIASGFFGDQEPTWISEAHGFVTNHEYDTSLPVKQRPHSAYHYWYRTAEMPMVPERRLSTQVSFDDPAPFRPGMVALRLDLHGHLVDFHATPAVGDTQERTPIKWGEFFSEERLGMNFRDFAEVQSTRTPRTSVYDVLHGWQQSGVPEAKAMQLFGATLENQLVACRISWPLVAADEPITTTKMPIIDSTRLAIVVLILVAAVVAPINVRRGRSDRKGAFRIGVCAVMLTLLGWAFGASITGDFALDSQTLLSGIQSAVFVGCVAWCFYLALEPFVRRFWPQALITWTRLLRGRFGDPELGRDILFGLTTGICCHVFAKSFIQLLRWLSFEPRPFVGVVPDVLLGGRAAMSGLLDSGLFAFIEGIFLLMFLFALRLPIRVKWIAPAMFVVFFTLQFSLMSPEYTPIHLLLWSGAALLMIRFGLVALVCFQFVRHIIEAFPLPGDMSQWYASYALIPFSLIAFLGAYAFYTSSLRPKGADFRII